jgi:soluble lytic murein transglycosylase-like protein
MPFWTRLIGDAGHNLFHLRTNLRYGCVILRHYLDRENGDLFRALGRYNGSLGRAEYPTAVAAAMRRYEATVSVPVPMVRVSAGASAGR